MKLVEKICATERLKLFRNNGDVLLAIYESHLTIEDFKKLISNEFDNYDEVKEINICQMTFFPFFEVQFILVKKMF